METFELGYMQEKHAAKIKEALDGKTFMNFRIETGVSPYGTSVVLSTDNPTPFDSVPYTDREILEFALYCMATA